MAKSSGGVSGVLLDTAQTERKGRPKPPKDADASILKLSQLPMIVGADQSNVGCTKVMVGVIPIMLAKSDKLPTVRIVPALMRKVFETGKVDAPDQLTKRHVGDRQLQLKSLAVPVVIMRMVAGVRIAEQGLPRYIPAYCPGRTLRE